MIKLKQILTEDISPITKNDIFNFYYLFSLSSYHPEVLKTDYGSFIQSEYIDRIKNKYIMLFKNLVMKQLMKYYERKRIDPDFDITKVNAKSSTSVLRDLMLKTYRSDMKRRNTTWNQICEFLTGLENASTVKDKYLMIDRLNSCIHNTGTSILGKIDSGLVQSYDFVHQAKSIKDYEKFVDKDLRQLMHQA